MKCSLDFVSGINQFNTSQQSILELRKELSVINFPINILNEQWNDLLLLSTIYLF